MSNKRNQSNVKVCNHKPGDKWDEGCCGDERPKNKSSETTRNQVHEAQEWDEVLDQSELSPSFAT